MTKALRVSKELALPPDTVTSTLVVYGGKGMGKTNFGSVLVEECARVGLRFSVIDPMGVWHGLRHSEDGKAPGIEVLILGGIHGDIPIEPTGGAVVADLVVDEDVSVVIDISRRPDGTMWSIGERVRFVTAYAKRLYQRQGEKRRPVMQVIDEAARFAPQIVRQGESDVAACMGAVAIIVEEGRNVGIGVTLITQRSARLNKDVAELADCMISFRVVGPNSTRAVLDWLGEHVEKKRLKDLGEQLRALPRGSALVVSPGWLEFEGVVPFRARRTFDSSATPKPGERERRASGPGAKPDLQKYQARMKETIERVAAQDPRALQTKVAELQAELKKARQAKEPKAKVEIREVYVLKEGQLKRLEAAAKSLATASDRAKDAAHDIQAGLVAVTWPDRGANASQALLGRPPLKPPAELPYSSRATTPATATINSRPPGRSVAPRRPAPATQKEPGELSRYAEDLVQTVARRHPMALTRSQISTLSGRSPRSSSFDGAMGELLKAGILLKDRDLYMLSDEGLKLGGANVGQPQSPEEVRATWLRALPGYESTMLEALMQRYPQAFTREDLAAAIGKSLTSSSFDGAISSLRKNGLATTDHGQVRASDTLFMEASA